MFANKLTAQDSTESSDIYEIINYDEIPVYFMIEGSKSFYSNVLYSNHKILYINIEDLFKSLLIPSDINKKDQTLIGYLELENQKYKIDYIKNSISYKNNIYLDSTDNLIQKNDIYFISSTFLLKALGIKLDFNFRSLAIKLSSDFELPIIKKARNDKLRKNNSDYNGEIKVDTIIKRNYHLFIYGMLDWNLSSYQSGNNIFENNIGLGLGSEFLYGETNIFLNYYVGRKFDYHQLRYLWNWVDNDKTFIKQAQIGLLSTQSISFLNSPVVGVTIRNSPTTLRKATGHYVIHDYTNPNWLVELYINNIMIEYVKADASGLYEFKVPYIYGYTTLKLKFYGPMGEEQSQIRTINMPYTIIPAGQYEYSITLGVLQSNTSNKFEKSEINYGLNDFITLGGGLEYLSSISDSPFLPFLKITIQPLSTLTISGEHAIGVKSHGLIDYFIMQDVLFEFDYTRYDKNQKATLFN